MRFEDLYGLSTITFVGEMSWVYSVIVEIPIKAL